MDDMTNTELVKYKGLIFSQWALSLQLSRNNKNDLLCLLRLNAPQRSEWWHVSL